MQGWAQAVQEQSTAGISQIHQGMHALQTTGGCARYHYYRALLAEAYAGVGQIDKACSALSEAFADGHNTGECWWEAELYRLKGELLLLQSMDHCHAAEASFQHALTVARYQQTKSLELRAATSLSRLWQQQEKRQQAHELLTAVYNRFMEGFDTADLQEARALLAALHA
jgi:predicted ATPase